MKILLSILLTGFFSIQFQQCGNKDENLCAAIEGSDSENIKKISNSYLKTLDSGDDENINFEKIKDWLESQECIEKVKVSDEIIETYPPLVEFYILIKVPRNVQMRLSVSFGDEYQFNELKTRN